MESNILLTKYIPKDKNASQKAPEDIEKIFSQNFGATYRVRSIDNLFISYFDTIKSMIKIQSYKNSNECNLFVQWPLYVRRPLKSSWFLNDRFKKKIALIHDLDSLRLAPTDITEVRKEVNELNKFDCVIAHNKCMKNWLIENGLTTEIITLNIFDYLLDYKLDLEHSSDYQIVVAGNLNKSLYLKEIDKVVMHKINAYGPLTDYTPPSNMNYMGSFTPNELPKKIRGEFGLIWDGDSTETCSGNNGNYMCYNNPHKLSLYISCGIPVITWEKAAIAEFIENHDIGFVIKSLSDIDSVLSNITVEQYKRMVGNAKRLADKLVKGQSTIDAVNLVLKNDK